MNKRVRPIKMPFKIWQPGFEDEARIVMVPVMPGEIWPDAKYCVPSQHSPIPAGVTSGGCMMSYVPSKLPVKPRTVVMEIVLGGQGWASRPAVESDWSDQYPNNLPNVCDSISAEAN